MLFTIVPFIYVVVLVAAVTIDVAPPVTRAVTVSAVTKVVSAAIIGHYCRHCCCC